MVDYLEYRLNSSGVDNKPEPVLPESVEHAAQKGQEMALACLPMSPSAAYESAPQLHAVPEHHCWYDKLGEMMRQDEPQ
jgi:hypothetical protein